MGGLAGHEKAQASEYDVTNSNVNTTLEQKADGDVKQQISTQDQTADLTKVEQQPLVQEQKVEQQPVIAQEQKIDQTKTEHQKAVIDVAKQAIKDGIVYIEIRFAPLLHIRKGLHVVEVLAAFCRGVEYVEKYFDITVRGIICGMKNHSLADNIQLFDFLKEKEEYNKYIVGVDLAGVEKKSPLGIQSKAIQYAKSLGLNISLHAGECNCAKNVYDSIRLGANRVGHGLASFNDDDLLELLSREKVMLEICPKSNLQSKVIQNIKDLDLNKLISMDVPFIINTGTRTVTNTTLVEEYKLLLDNGLITIEQIKSINLKALAYAFDDEVKFKRV